MKASERQPVTATLVGLALALAAFEAAAAGCANPREIAYEPQVVELRGAVSIARARHPNGTRMKYPIMYLAQPVSIQADGVNAINSTEPCVSEVQLIGSDRRIHERLFASGGTRLVVRGTVFHEHTAWHMRRLVMVVSEANRAGRDH